MVSIVLPTYNEADVVQETLRRAYATLRGSGEEFELIVVDDSSGDGTAELAEALGGLLPVRVLRRPGRRGLATAVVDGWALARGDLLGVMDADLQHPPEVLEKLVGALRTPDVDLAIASRYVAAGGTTDWSWLRRVISRGATHLAASVLPCTLATVTDPMSGMFVVRAQALGGVHLDPLGYKILLEILAKARYRELVEVPYVFEQRGHGSSKLGARQGLEYLQHLGRLACSTNQFGYWFRYVVVGLSGALINVGVLYMLAERAGWRPALALPAAIQLALFSNFFWNHVVTFRSRQGRRGAKPAGVLSRLIRFETLCVPGAVLNVLVTLVLYGQGVELLLAATAGVLAGGLWNLSFNLPATWRLWDASSLPGRLRSARAGRAAEKV